MAPRTGRAIPSRPSWPACCSRQPWSPPRPRVSPCWSSPASALGCCPALPSGAPHEVRLQPASSATCRDSRSTTRSARARSSPRWPGLSPPASAPRGAWPPRSHPASALRASTKPCCVPSSPWACSPTAPFPSWARSSGRWVYPGIPACSPSWFSSSAKASRPSTRASQPAREAQRIASSRPASSPDPGSLAAASSGPSPWLTTPTSPPPTCCACPTSTRPRTSPSLVSTRPRPSSCSSRTWHKPWPPPCTKCSRRCNSGICSGGSSLWWSAATTSTSRPGASPWPHGCLSPGATWETPRPTWSQRAWAMCRARASTRPAPATTPSCPWCSRPASPASASSSRARVLQCTASAPTCCACTPAPPRPSRPHSSSPRPPPRPTLWSSGPCASPPLFPAGPQWAWA